MTPLVLIPGMMCDARMWGGIDATLGVPVIHHLPTGADSMPALAARFLTGAPPTFALAGLSLGGILAMEILRQAPARVTRLALLDTNPRAEMPEAQARRAPQIARALAGDLEGVMRDDMKPNYLAPGPRKDEILNLCMDMALSLGPETFARQSRALRDRADQQATLAAYKGPALVLMGAEDRLCPLDRHQLMHVLMPQSQLRILPAAAHLPPLERPAETAAALRDWLA
ncbi:MAG: alpha/beta hydrolase [Tabrizicola sp.]|uniref:alpha/beta fold hydrolase n=1 Tax=Tabrizicola sp. TaxID=2005166 RepID=UPI002735B584|nr:alpha/beta hydrolase [Tabrizicola sp.]MDP3263613.1 alpha/beta hydrolase [Tabrizicola sp.]MDP3646977.1 alpha/beta hydrolase [Paracoccaceae bacterium]MDZ4069821.1 alpha/beta hydrolase [Tabrizicola sp.]